MRITSNFCKSLSTSATPNPLPATFIRGGTSKGIFINRSSLPEDQNQWEPILLGIMGSPDPEYGRQLNGMGGGASSLSKVCVVGSPSPEQQARGIQAEYTFIQVGIHDSSIDYSGNCGNLSSMIGAFALDEGICLAPSSNCRTTIRTFNTNTQKIIDTTFPVSEGGKPVLNLPEASIAGVHGLASRIILEFVNPSGARTGKLLPSQPIERLSIPQLNKAVRVSYVDATNPTIFVSQKDLESFLPVKDYLASTVPAREDVGCVLEIIRQLGAQRMGLDPKAQAQPKIAMIHAPDDLPNDVDIVVNALSMGVLHKAVPMTVGLCLGVAASVPGTLAWEIMHSSRKGRAATKNGMIRLKHPSGLVDVGAEFAEDGSVLSAKVVRTGRMLMKGVVWW